MIGFLFIKVFRGYVFGRRVKLVASLETIVIGSVWAFVAHDGQTGLIDKLGDVNIIVAFGPMLIATASQTLK